ncbi:MAG TPA: hypothetical protein VMZ26_10460 [Pyrinomonadaceae bacterium]|nr:hypothetical protein [Pyrinomonadaceae bacterium]
MCYTGLFKRIIPFALTFAAGLFLASFFVSIGLPTSRWRVERRFNRFQESQQLRRDYENLREKYRELQVENDELRKRSDAADFFIPNAVPPVDLEEHHPPQPPPPPRQPKRMRVEVLQ